jgi:hypothetical protein
MPLSFEQNWQFRFGLLSLSAGVFSRMCTCRGQRGVLNQWYKPNNYGWTKCYLVPFVVFFLTFTASAQTQYQLNKSDSTIVPSSLPPQVLFDIRSASPAAQQALLPLYEQEWKLEQQLNEVKWQSLADTLGGLSMAVAGAFDNAGRLAANNLAAEAGVPGYRFKGENAATSAQEPAEMPRSVIAGMNLVNQIQTTEEAISRTQKRFGIPATARTPWSILFPDNSKALSPDEVVKMLAPAAHPSAWCLTSRKELSDWVGQDTNGVCSPYAPPGVLQSCTKAFYQNIDTLEDFY